MDMTLTSWIERSHTVRTSVCSVKACGLQSNSVIPGNESLAAASNQCTTTEDQGSVDFPVVSQMGKENSSV